MLFGLSTSPKRTGCIRIKEGRKEEEDTEMVIMSLLREIYTNDSQQGKEDNSEKTWGGVIQNFFNHENPLSGGRETRHEFRGEKKKRNGIKRYHLAIKHTRLGKRAFQLWLHNRLGKRKNGRGRPTWKRIGRAIEAYCIVWVFWGGGKKRGGFLKWYFGKAPRFGGEKRGVYWGKSRPPASNLRGDQVDIRGEYRKWGSQIEVVGGPDSAL